MHTHGSGSACCYAECVCPRAKLGLATPISLDNTCPLPWRSILMLGFLALLLSHAWVEGRFMTGARSLASVRSS